MIIYLFIKFAIFGAIFSDIFSDTLSNIFCRSHICYHDKAAIDRPCWYYYFLFRA